MPVVGNWTYSGDPSDSPRDAVRFLVRDTDINDQKLSDEEIAWLLSQNGNNVYAAAEAGAVEVATFFSGQARTKTVGALSITYEAKATEYRSLASMLRFKRAVGFGSAIVPYSGGISVSDKALQRADTDYDQPFFRRGMHDSPGTENASASTST